MKFIFTKKGNLEARLIGGLIVLMIFFIGSYVYFLNRGVAELVAKKENLKNLRNLQMEYQTIENKYLGESKKLSFEYARSLGFVEAESSLFVVRPAGLSLAE